MDLLVLGGTRHVGRAVVADALARGWQVTALNRGVTGALPAGVRHLVADRSVPEALAAALDGLAPDVVVDTWALAPRHATSAARELAGRAGAYGYVSSRSVYVWPPVVGGDESDPVVEGDPDAELTDYAADKRGGELGVLAAQPHALLARAGLVLGPWEDVGRMPWWLGRIARGGRVVAPGDPSRRLQYVDCRDLAHWLLGALATEGGVRGPVDVVSPPGHTTTAELLQACVDVTGSGAELVWVPENRLEQVGAEPWTELPAWVPSTGELVGLMESDTSLAASTGLVCRPVQETVADTWAWLQAEGWPPARPDRPSPGLPPEKEAALLGAPR